MDKRFRGPSSSRRGGYTCGMLAAHIKGVAEVTLFEPIPLNKRLFVKRQLDRSVELLDEETIIATAKPAEFQLPLPSPSGFGEAIKASEIYIGFNEKYLYPECFCCGRNRQQGEGLRIFPGRLHGSNLFAAPWIPDK